MFDMFVGNLVKLCPETAGSGVKEIVKRSPDGFSVPFGKTEIKYSS